MDLLKNFEANWLKQFAHLQKTNLKILVAVSGGLDSVVLTDILYKCDFDFAIAHCNFQLRGEESERDEFFVKSLQEKYGKEILVKKFDTEKYASEKKLSIQEAARNLRYNWFTEVITAWQSQPNFIATAHHVNDNIETLLLNFFRGTGISGLHAISAKQNNILRPLLFASREEILQYAKQYNLNWVEDSSNATDKYARNFLRLNLLPSVKKIFPSVENNLLENIERFKEVESLYNQSIALYKKKLVAQKGNEFFIPVLKLQQCVPLQTIIWEIIKDFDFSASQVGEIKKLLVAANGSYVSSAQYRIIKNRNWLIITPFKTTTAQNILIEETDNRIDFKKGELIFETLTAHNISLSNNNSIAMLDAEQIKFPLLLRKWKQGDYFYPLGMNKKKKLSRFFIDLKLSVTEKEKVWVLEANKKILWIVGYRIDERVKVLHSTKNILKITYLER